MTIMKKYIFNILAILSALLLLGACVQKENEQQGCKDSGHSPFDPEPFTIVVHLAASGLFFLSWDSILSFSVNKYNE